MDFTLIIPILDEEPILRRNAMAIYDYLKGLSLLGSFEIILSCNGCTDGSEEIAGELGRTHPGIRLVSIKERGLGRAIRRGVDNATYKTVMFYAIDMPFGLGVIGDSLKVAADNANAVVIGSKGHKDSIVQKSFMRRVFSFGIGLLNRCLFALEVSDTQGSILFSVETVRRYREFMDDNGAFFQTQIIIYSKIAGAQFIEIPVRLQEEVRASRFRAADALRYILAIFAEKIKLLRHGMG